MPLPLPLPLLPPPLLPPLLPPVATTEAKVIEPPLVALEKSRMVAVIGLVIPELKLTKSDV